MNDNFAVFFVVQHIRLVLGDVLSLLGDVLSVARSSDSSRI
jgi:hypothetical protein